MSGASGEPRNLVERAADAAFEAIERVLREGGAEPEIHYVALVAQSVPEGEPDACAAAGGNLPDNPAKRILAFLVNNAIQVAKQLGLEVKVVPFGKG